ncbi:hypothetical protein [Chitinophaga sp. MD30]|uniref:hypothetical protein n=1 Tax=Chitinophaga sp. MD30 TaxID=2033437 RepID=UPI0018DF10AB|nr:hypothetical protein [Chitinophaga sp. MD30]
MLDIALQTIGSKEQVMQIAVQNENSITDDLFIGQKIEHGQVNLNNRVIAHFIKNGISPATGNTTADDQEGIGVWNIQIDFKVS